MIAPLSKNHFSFRGGLLIAQGNYSSLYPNDGLVAPHKCDQGTVTDCGFIASLNSSLSKPNKAFYIARAVAPSTGCIKVKLFGTGNEHEIDVVDYELTGNGIENHPACRSIEVAASKLLNNGTYSDESLDCISSFESLLLLTGKTPESIPVNENSHGILDGLSSNIDDLIVTTLSKPSSSFYKSHTFDLQTVDGQTIAWTGHKCQAVSFDTESRHVTIAPIYKSSKRATITFDEYQRCFTDSRTLEDIFGTNRTILFEHYYSVLSIDKKAKTVTLLNPHKGSTPMVLSYDNFIKAFDHLTFVPV